MEGSIKAVIYARYSSDNQREESIEGQIRECTAFAEKNGITILRHYIDRAYSAKTDNRPEFQQMIKDSGKYLFDMVLVSLLAKASPHHGLDATCFENLHGLVAQLFAGKHFASFLKRRPIQIKIDCMGLCCIIVDL